MTEREFIDNMKLLLEPINNKLEMMENEMRNVKNEIGNVKNEIGNVKNEINNLRNDMQNMEFQNKREFRAIRQDIETVLVILDGNNMLPNAQ
ncbi:MAG: hypothetical protein HFG63_15645 [Lachnospiraceae bacterium]|jgi:predicted  nucleic acid-binding Zn-ribbon protein|nr:hypothetical protein [Lachnospiraceae bacterium]